MSLIYISYMNCMRLTSRRITIFMKICWVLEFVPFFLLVSLHQCRRLPQVDECFWSCNHHFSVVQDIDWLDVQVNESHAPRWWTLLIDFNKVFNCTYSCHRVLTISVQYAYNKPIRIIINCTDTFVYFDTLKERIFCYYFAVVFFHFVILVQRIFHQSRCTDAASNDRLYTYNILPYQPGAYEAVYLHCHSRLV